MTTTPKIHGEAVKRNVWILAYSKVATKVGMEMSKEAHAQ